MIKITREAVKAFFVRENFRKGNTRVEVTDEGTKMFLHNNLIAKIDKNRVLSITNAGWQSNTTKERLNGLPGVRISQKNFEWYLNGEKWDGSWIELH
jgi:hypothetical protein